MAREPKPIFFQELKGMRRCPILIFRKPIQQAEIFPSLRIGKMLTINPFDIRLLSSWISCINIEYKRAKQDNFILET
jgi:hypothetical protein